MSNGLWSTIVDNAVFVVEVVLIAAVLVAVAYLAERFAKKTNETSISCLCVPLQPLTLGEICKHAKRPCRLRGPYIIYKEEKIPPDCSSGGICGLYIRFCR